MKKKILIIFVLIIFVCYYAILHSTNVIIEDFTSIVSNKLDPNILYGKLDRYKIPSFNEMIYKNSDVKIKRLFVFHNFKKGVMYVKYSYIAYDEKNNIITGSSEVNSKWYIKKLNGRWIVYDIDEKP